MNFFHNCSFSQRNQKYASESSFDRSDSYRCQFPSNQQVLPIIGATPSVFENNQQQQQLRSRYPTPPRLSNQGSISWQEQTGPAHSYFQPLAHYPVQNSHQPQPQLSSTTEGSPPQTTAELYPRFYESSLVLSTWLSGASEHGDNRDNGGDSFEEERFDDLALQITCSPHHWTLNTTIGQLRALYPQGNGLIESRGGIDWVLMLSDIVGPGGEWHIREHMDEDVDMDGTDESVTISN